MQKNNLFSFLLDGGTLPPPGIRAQARGTRACARGAAAAGGRVAAAADRDAKEKTNKFFCPAHVYFKAETKLLDSYCWITRWKN